MVEKRTCRQLVMLLLWSTLVLSEACAFSRGDKFKLWDSHRNSGITYYGDAVIPEGVT